MLYQLDVGFTHTATRLLKRHSREGLVHGAINTWPDSIGGRCFVSAGIGISRAETQRRRDAETQRCRDAETQRCRDAEMQRCRGRHFWSFS
jgi:hypothetical protein